MNQPSPIIVFTFNRPEHTQATLEALSNNDLAGESALHIFCDGPRGQDDEEKTSQVRAVAHAASGFGSVQVVEREKNLGLAGSVIRGISEVLEHHETVIVLEDDMITSPVFLRYMNNGLEKYRDIDKVISVCGYTFPTDQVLPEAFFLPGAHCWGWATWQRGWNLFERDAGKLLEQIIANNLIYEFDVAGTEGLTQLLNRSAQGDKRVDSWALRWMASAILHNKLTLFPGKSLLRNTGFEGSGTHGVNNPLFDTELTDYLPEIAGIEVATDPLAYTENQQFLIRWRKGGKLKMQLYYALAAVLPEALKKPLYSAIIKRSLTRFNRQMAAGMQG